MIGRVSERRATSTNPAFRNAIGDRRVLVARKAQVNEPLAVEQACRFFEQRDPFAVVLEQLVVRSNGGRGSSLGLDVRKTAEW